MSDMYREMQGTLREMQHLAREVRETVQPQAPPRAPSPPPRDRPPRRAHRHHHVGTEASLALQEFRKLKPPIFRGERDTVSAEYWLKGITKLFDTMSLESDSAKIKLAVHQLTEDADEWWATVKAEYDVRRMTCDNFEYVFWNDIFLPISRIP